mgnify:CR=1 FL=1
MPATGHDAQTAKAVRLQRCVRCCSFPPTMKEACQRLGHRCRRLILDLEDSVSAASKAGGARARQGLHRGNGSRASPGRKSWCASMRSTRTYWQDDLIRVSSTHGPDAILLPKARSGEDVHTLSVALGSAEQSAPPSRDGARASSRSRPRRRISLLQMHSYIGASTRLLALTWGAEDLARRRSGRAATVRMTAAPGPPPFRLARDLCLFDGRGRRGRRHRHGVRQLSRCGRLPRRVRGGGAGRLQRQNGDPSQSGRPSSTRCLRRLRRRLPSRRRSCRPSRTIRKPA